MQLQLDNAGLRQAMFKGPESLTRHLDRAIGRIVLNMANDARQNAPKAMSQLTQSIGTARPSALEGLVTVASEHGIYVEQGTGLYGPAGRPSHKLPPVKSIEDWIKAGSGIQPNDPDDSTHDLAYKIARRIAATGTRPQPFLGPAFNANKADAERRMNAAIDAALAEIAR